MSQGVEDKMQQQFIVLIAEALEKERDEMSLTDRFREYEEWDSLALLSVIAAIKHNYDITIPRKEFDNLFTMADLFQYIMNCKR